MASVPVLAGDHVTGRELGIGMDLAHVAPAMFVDEGCALAAECLGEEGHGVEGCIERGGVELDELGIADGGSGPRGHGQAVAGHLAGVGGVQVEPADATGGQHDARRDEGDEALPGIDGQDTHDPVAIAQEVHDQCVVEPFDVVAGDGRSDQGPHHLRAGRVAVGVHDPAPVVARLPAEGEGAVRRGVESGSERDQPLDAFGRGHGDEFGDLGPTEAAAHLLGVGGVAVGVVVVAHRGGDAALGPPARAGTSDRLGDHDAVAVRQGDGEAGDTRPDHDAADGADLDVGHERGGPTASIASRAARAPAATSGSTWTS